MVKRISCRNCSKPIPPKPSGTGRRARYCDRHCATQYRAARQLKPVNHRKQITQCIACNLPFNPIRDGQKLCSYACRLMSQRVGFKPKLSQNILQAQLNKETVTNQIIQRQANKRETLPIKPVKRRGPNPETAKRKARNAALKTQWKQTRALVKQTRAARYAARVSPFIDHLRTFEP